MTAWPASPGLRRAAALGLLGFALLLPYLLVSPFLSAHAELDARIESSLRILARPAPSDADRQDLLRRAEELKRRGASADALLPPGTDALAAAALQDRVKRLVDGAGAELRSSQILPMAEEDGLRRIGLRVQIAGHLDSLQQILHAVEGQRPFLFVDAVELRRRAGTRVTTQPEEEKLDLRLDFHGFQRRGAAP